jgi:thioredoxin reductase (NADPH)
VLFVLIGAEAATDWLPSEISRDKNGLVLTGTDAMKAGQWNADREPLLSKLAVRGSSPSATSAPGRLSV